MLKYFYKNTKFQFVAISIMFFTFGTAMQAAPLQRYWVCVYTQGSGGGCSGGGTVLSCFFELSDVSPCSKYDYWYESIGGTTKANCCDGPNVANNGLNISPDILMYPDESHNVINVKCADSNIYQVLDFDNILPTSWSSYAMKLTLIENNIHVDFFARDSSTTDIFMTSFANPDLTITIPLNDVLDLCKEEPSEKSLSYEVINHKKPLIIRKDKLDFTVISSNNDDDLVKVLFINENVIKNNNVTFSVYTIDGKEINKTVNLDSETFELSIKYGELPKGIIIFSASYNSEGIKNSFNFKYSKE